MTLVLEPNRKEPTQDQAATRPPSVGLWTPRAPWFCILALVALELVLSLALRVAFGSPHSAAWLFAHEYPLQAWLKVFRFFAWLSITWAFSGAASQEAFPARLGLNRPPTFGGWWWSCAALAISLLDRFGAARGLTSPNPASHGFYQNGGILLVFYIFYVVLPGPFYEEVVLRGFLYPAFRANYGRPASTLIILAVGAYFHWPQLSHSFWTPFCLIFLWLVLCMVRELSGSLWNCVLAHAVYNAAQAFKWPVYVPTMILLLLLVYWFSRSRTPTSEEGQDSRASSPSQPR